jgi:hypothetical protein
VIRRRSQSRSLLAKVASLRLVSYRRRGIIRIESRAPHELAIFPDWASAPAYFTL